MLVQHVVFIQYRDQTMFMALVVFDELQQTSAAVATAENKNSAVIKLG